jgi:glycosyltransferase involved in cell wall biosynthesis
MAKISVVMSVHNGAASLAATLESIFAQTETDFELIVIDDASTDDSPAILGRYADRDTRMRVVRYDENRGLTRSLIAGCAAARGTYIARHDAGDLSLPTRFAREAALLDATLLDPNVLAFVACWTEFVGPELEHLYVAKGTGRANAPTNVIDATAERAMLDGPAHHGCVMFRRDAYERAGGYRSEFYYGQDWDLWYRLAAVGKFQMVPEVLYRARVVPESISVEARHAQDELAELSLAALRARLASEPEEPLLARAANVVRVRGNKTRARANGFYFIGEVLRRNGDPRARRYLRAAIAASPLTLKAWLRWLQSLIPARGIR